MVDKMSEVQGDWTEEDVLSYYGEWVSPEIVKRLMLVVEKGTDNHGFSSLMATMRWMLKEIGIEGIPFYVGFRRVKK